MLVRAAVALPIVAAAQRLLGVRRCQAVLTWLTPLQELPERDRVANVDIAHHIAHLIRIAAARSFFPANCLNRSLVLWWFLRSQGLASEICYGARTGERGFEAHAWVKYASEIIGDSPDIVNVFLPFEMPDGRARTEASTLQ